jgi:hypothetical protein
VAGRAAPQAKLLETATRTKGGPKMKEKEEKKRTKRMNS